MPQKAKNQDGTNVIPFVDPGSGRYFHALLEGIANNRTNAANELCRLYGERINRWVWSLLGNDKDHDDVVQDIYMNIFKSIQSVKNPDSLDAWINGVVIRSVRHEIRKRKVRRLIVPSSNSIDGAYDNSNPHKTVHAERFYALVNSMRATNRILFVLRYIVEVPLDEIAACQNCSRSTAKRRIRKARKEFEIRATRDPILGLLMEGFSNAK